MADKLKDAEDQLLESLFAGDALADDGFSKVIVRRIRRQIWIRRLAVPIAILIGGAIAFEPLTQLASVGSALTTTAVSLAPVAELEVPASVASQLPLIMSAAAFFFVGLAAFRVSED